MATPFLNGINGVGIPFLGFRMENLAADPTAYGAGHSYFNTGINAYKYYSGTAWVVPIQRSFHTGTQTASTISDLTTTVQGYSLSSFAVPTGNISLNSFRITNASDPQSLQDYATMNYVLNQTQATAAGISSKDPVVAVATTNIATLSGTSTVVDGVTLGTAGQRVLLTGQTTASQNGPWVIASGAWTRPTTEGATQWELDPGALWLAIQGTSYAGTQWRISNSGTITPGTTAISIVQFSAGTVISAGNGILNTSGTLSIKLASNSGMTVDGTGLYLTNNYSFSTGLTVTSNVVTFNAKAGGGITSDGTGVYLTNPIISGNGITVTAGSVAINAKAGGGIIADGTGAYVDTTTITRKITATIGDGTSTTLTVTHNFNTRAVRANIYLATTPYNEVQCDVNHTTVNSIDFIFATAPTSNQYSVVIMG